MKVLECVPNFSEGSDDKVLSSIADALASVEGVRLLDVCRDPDHNRTVFTFVGRPGAVEDGAAAACDRALGAIDMCRHRGVHPRIGAVDVVPFVPISGLGMKDAVEAARRFGKAFAERNGVPVYFYGEAALRTDRKDLSHIRRGGYESLERKLSDPQWAPDAGPALFDPCKGATAVGAREPLIAYNINLRTDDLNIAKRIAGEIRQSGGGLRSVKAIGVPLKSRGIVQVSMNLTNFRETSIKEVFDIVTEKAGRQDVEVLESEIVGLVPAGAVKGVTPGDLKLINFSDSLIIENHL
ncbi:MAG TPA: glutamate formimidoyltransferase [Syntrophales bacterium]|nr:glutamate formimidoyltransferase [Syntrophales bacterium]HOX93806.1 glutamate formimidoyltransferase [Syntrophales bacterium]HPI57753.1 glutamate formimidoyltransferase [Syntrophales bacterium]HPN25837.1 glutamate formimidoyltransferase [Syntrophales bacterium]HQM30357.1 glutamate formimidoyltransferase [Syntrophales bacterium]